MDEKLKAQLNEILLEPYARARTDAELRCALPDELYEKLIAGEESLVEGAVVEH